MEAGSAPQALALESAAPALALESAAPALALESAVQQDRVDLMAKLVKLSKMWSEQQNLGNDLLDRLVQVIDQRVWVMNSGFESSACSIHTEHDAECFAGQKVSSVW